MDFPLNRAVADVPLGTAAGSRLVRAVAGTIPVREVLHNPDINNLLIVLEGGREELLSIRPRPGELLDAHPEKLLVIVTAKGEGLGCPLCWPLSAGDSADHFQAWSP